ncbi:MAG TPA: Ppx/GppA phosphatase family protein [Steroidobacteraceae bacterium]|jgi:exopolyphosphatase/guanosine-5'-triphosphate,3'-diphosphate pyrophosphatase|nr:Ppx/GppA phosphatase family protein [Steroidobacteraceae bacterium]
MRLAAIDIGTNSVHMIVVNVRPDFSFEIVDQEKEMVRLGAGGLDGRNLTETAMDAALQALKKFHRLAQSHQVDEIMAAATSATREAENGPAFLAAIQAQTGIRPRVISGTEEARLIHMAAVYGVDIKRGKAVVIDIGGGSVEVTVGNERPQLARSFKTGVIRMTERFVKTDPLAERDERKLVRFLQSEISSFAKQVVQAGFERVIGTSGTILSLGTMAAYEMDGAEPDELRNRRIPSKQIRKLREKLTSLSLAERLRIPGMEPRRGDLAVAGSVILDTILRELDAEDITLCDLALREGLVLDYIHQHRTEIARADRYPDVRRRSVVELGERCNYFAQHAAQVSRLAVSMFDQTRGVHGLKDREREWLEYAALLHDVGVHISYDKHHRHSYYLIKHGDLRGFDPQEIEVIGLIARYHRRASPKKGHPGYGELPSDLRKAVKVLSSIVRLAEGLDRSHVQVLDSITLANRGDDYLMQLRTNGDAELELWAAGRHVEPLEDTLGKPVRFEVAPAPARAKRTPVRASAPAKTASAG